MIYERLEEYKKYIKYVVLLIVLIIALLILKGCGSSSNKLEKKVQEATLDYIGKNNIFIGKETYIELSTIGEVEGTELCYKSSGAIVSNESGNIKVVPYLNCPDYETNLVKNKEKYVSLNGNSVMILNQGESFNDPGYTLKTEAEVETVGEVKDNPGIYTIKYYVYADDELKETLERKVIVTKSDKTATISGITNKDYPTITLIGDSNITLRVGEKYVEPGYKAVDYTDGKISRSVKVEPNKIDTSRAGGPYTINYTVTNSKGYTVTTKRTVTVVRQKSDLNISLSTETSEISNKSIIKLIINGSGYSHTLLPNNNLTYSTTYNYEAKYNNRYTFRIYDTYGNVYTKEITVDSIDSTPPTGTCEATVTDAATQITVNANDNKGVAGYSYILDNDKTEILDSNSYQTNKSAKKVSVSLVDIAGNTSTINCEIKKQQVNNIMISGSCGVSDIYIDVKTCYGNKLIRSKIPLEEYLLGVIYGEENSNDPEFLKAFIIFARTYTLNRIGYGKNSNYSIKSCSSDQNWCDVDMGCYREQTQEMFDLCIKYAVDYPRPDYSAKTCANRVTTFPGTKTVGKPTFYVTNPGWPADKEKSAVASANTSKWHGPLDQKTKDFYKQMLEETAGLVVKSSDGKMADISFQECEYYSHEHKMCTNKARELSNKGYKVGQIISEFTKKYPNAKIECYNS